MNQGRMEIFKYKGETCANGGISQDHDDVLVWSKFDKDAPANAVVIIEDVCCGKRRIRAVPANKEKAWTMFGGSFIYTSNGCVPHSGEPISLHDRIED
jgi:hypothetical protein